MPINPEDILKKHIEGKKPVDDSKILAATSLITINTTREIVDASTLLAKTTQASAELLASTTRVSAEQLAETTKTSARLLTWLTLALIAVGIIQIVIAIVALPVNP